jgi:hypothetical protein
MFIYTIGDIIGAAILVAIIGMVISKRIKQHYCKHEKYYETMACNAVCVKCGKNLGFIGSVKKERRARAALKGEK